MEFSSQRVERAFSCNEPTSRYDDEADLALDVGSAMFKACWNDGLRNSRWLQDKPLTFPPAALEDLTENPLSWILWTSGN